MSSIADSRHVKDPVETSAELVITELGILSHFVCTPQDRQRAQRILFESHGGESVLAAMESKLGLALVPVEQVH
jgi:hypothetical protein